MSTARWLVLVASLVMPSYVGAAELLSAAVQRRSDESFEIAFRLRLDAPVDSVRRLLKDYRVLADLSPSTLSSEIIAPGTPPNSSATPWLNVRMRPCVLMFCKTVIKVSQISRPNAATTRFELVPNFGDFEQATEALSLNAVPDDAASTHLDYHAILKPRFTVPRILGTWILRRVMGYEMSVAAEQAELRIKGIASQRVNQNRPTQERVR